MTTSRMARGVVWMRADQKILWILKKISRVSWKSREMTEKGRQKKKLWTVSISRGKLFDKEIKKDRVGSIGRDVGEELNEEDLVDENEDLTDEEYHEDKEQKTKVLNSEKENNKSSG